MTIASTTRDMQRATFIEGLHNSLRKQASQAMEEQQKFISLASSYIRDGLEEDECVELLMIDGLSRESAESYASMVLSEEETLADNLDDSDEYSFQFEDLSGNVWSSYDIGQSIRASSESEAMEKADKLLYASEDIEQNKVLSVNKVS